MHSQDRRTRLPLAAALLVALCALGLGVWAAGAGAQQKQQPQQQPSQQQPPADAEGPRLSPGKGEQPPNIVVVQTDDQTLEGLYAFKRSSAGGPKVRAMPTTLDQIAAKGISFNRYYVSYPLCCPSRVSLLTGRYAHNHNVRGNVPPSGGSTGFRIRTAHDHNLATWLQDAGYRTIHSGKFLNGYGDLPFDDGTEVAPGWDAWYSIDKADTHHYFYGYTLNVNGQKMGPFGNSGTWEPREYTERDPRGCPENPPEGEQCNLIEDKMTEIAIDEIEATPRRKPFYLQMDFAGPHGDYRHPAGPEPAVRYYNWFKGLREPRSRREGFDEADVSDKPRFIREAEHLSAQQIRVFRRYYQKMLESLRTIDDEVRRVRQTLISTNRLRNTYIIFTSDNGYFLGEHRLLGGKFLAYEPATHLPLLISGPGIQHGVETDELAANIDIAPTVLELAGAKADRDVDGRSLVPYIEDPEKNTRRAILFESFVESADVEANGEVSKRAAGDPVAGPSVPGDPGANTSNHRPEANASLLAPPKDYAGLRIGPWKYIAWPSGEKELYNIDRDPNELRSLHRVPNLYPIRNYMHRQLKRLIDCRGRECRANLPEIPMTRLQLDRFKAEKQREIRRKEIERERTRREREAEKQRREQQRQRQR